MMSGLSKAKGWIGFNAHSCCSWQPLDWVLVAVLFNDRWRYGGGGGGGGGQTVYRNRESG